MINTTDRPIVLIAGHALDQEIRSSLCWAEKLISDEQNETRNRQHKKIAFANFFGDGNRRTDVHLDEAFVLAAYDFATAHALDAAPALAIMSQQLKRRTVSATGFPQVKRGLKLCLVELWRRKALLLPTVFTPGPQFPMRNVNHELIRWLEAIDPTPLGDAQRSSNFRLHSYGPRLVFATEWSRVEDVSIQEIAELHLAHLKYANGLHPHSVGAPWFPWSQLPAELLKTFPDRVAFTELDLIRYSAWSARNIATKGKLEDFDPSAKPPPRPRAPRPSDLRPTRRDELSANASQASTHDAVLVYFKRIKMSHSSGDWKEGTPPVYPGREHIHVESVSAIWIQSFVAFLRHREHIQGYRSSDEVISSLNILADYLFLYLPWWRELFPTGKVGVPTAPKEFGRYAYVSRHSDEPLDSLPLPLLEVVRLRRPKAESAFNCIKHLTLYFRFVGAHFGDDEAVAGSAFRNPLDEEFDAPRLSGKKNKTNKQIIPRNIYGHLLFYCYAVEQFGQLLLQQALDGKFSDDWPSMQGAARYETARFGMTPIVRYRGKDLPVHSVPNVFTWVAREVAHEGRPTTVVVPHLTALRLLIASLETGLRCQSIQWLDRRTWDSLNKDAGEHYTYRLLVNTDKTKVEAWSPPVVYRVRHLLQREEDFQKLFADFDTFEPVPYEGYNASPFDPIRPLFKATTNGSPISDATYYDAWIALQVDFEAFYKDLSGERHVRLYYIKPRRTPDGQPVVKYVGREANAYCAISILAVHTPHSCRATFATNRQGQGILELSDVAELLGHEDVVTTAHYTKFSGKQLEERLQRSDAALLADYSVFDVGSESAYVRPDKPDSALMQSFAKDREGTLAAFRFMPSMALWSIEDEKLEAHDGLALLKTGPMSHIRFRETHVCPVGEECPADILRHIGAPKRCGLCPLATKCIDHLTAIAAKRNQLKERVRYLQAQYRRMEAAGEPSAALDALWDEIQLDVNEFLGWTLSEEVLTAMRLEAERNPDAASLFHVERPDIVRRHLRLITRQCDRTEFLLQRIAESNAYPSMTSPQVQMAASLLRRRLSAGQGLDALATLTDDGDDVRAAAAMLGTMMKASGLSTKDLAALLAAPAQSPAAAPLLLKAGAGDVE